MTRVVGGLLIIVVLALPPVRNAFEAVMALHMLVQIPLLAVAGGLLATGMPVRWKEHVGSWNRGGVTGILTAVLASTWWMVPRALDSALASVPMEIWKFISLPLLVGAPVVLSWRPLGPIGRGFVVANVLPMWAVVGWMYVAAPVRLCNFYLTDQQVVAGRWLVVASIAVGAGVGVLALLPPTATSFRRMVRRP